MDNSQQPVKGFVSTGITPEILSVLRSAHLTAPTPIQEKAIPVALQGADIVGIAQTGTGKTLAFSLPIIQNLRTSSGRALILVPTRELALQVEESIRRITRHLNPIQRTVCLIGGVPAYRQIKDLKSRPRIVIATPGRLNDLLDRKVLDLSDVVTLVLDEADRMLDMGFMPQIKQILEHMPKERQTMLFSATMATEVSGIATKYMQNPIRIEVSEPGLAASQIDQELCYVSQTGKTDLLQQFLNTHSGTVLVFSRTKHGASNLSKKLQVMGYTSTEIHSNRSLGQRRMALDGFKSGKYRVLVATDVAARGIDVRNISLVVNYDLPDAAEDYVHRIGRTGRAGKSGKAVSFATHEQYRDVKAIERLTKNTLPLSELSEKPQAQVSHHQAPSHARRPYGSNNAPSRRKTRTFYSGSVPTSRFQRS